MRFTQLTIFHVLYAIGICAGLWLGVTVGHRFGTAGAICGGVVGLVLGHFVGMIPNWLAYRAVINEIAAASNERLREIVDEPYWNFRQTLALLQLAAREADVSGVLPRILDMLQSNSRLTRLYGWDALRLVFTQHANRLPDYDPKQPAETCRQQVAALVRNPLR